MANSADPDKLTSSEGRIRVQLDLGWFQIFHFCFHILYDSFLDSYTYVVGTHCLEESHRGAFDESYNIFFFFFFFFFFFAKKTENIDLDTTHVWKVRMALPASDHEVPDSNITKT